MEIQRNVNVRDSCIMFKKFGERSRWRGRHQELIKKMMMKTTACLNMKETFYISHGSPMLSVDDSLPARHFLKSFVFPAKPKSVLMISAHWETTFPTLNAIDGTSDTIYDFYNFPEPLYQVRICDC